MANSFVQEAKKKQKEKGVENPPDLVLEDSDSDSDSDQKPKTNSASKSRRGDKTPEYKEEKRRKSLLKRAEKLKVQSDKLMAESRRAAQQYDQYIKGKAKVIGFPNLTASSLVANCFY